MNIMLKIQYDGTDFYGSQIQPAGRTVQGELESALKKIFSARIVTVFSGRTDSGVHAREQVVNFHIPASEIPPDKIFHPLNRLLPDDILVISSEEVKDDFNARYSAKMRTYRYYFRKEHNLFRDRYTLTCPFGIDIEKVNNYTHLFTGKKDFRSFCSANAEVNSYICDIKKIHFFKERDETVMEIASDRYLQNMVRIIVSVFLEISRNKISEKNILEIFEKKDRRAAPKTISPKGLFLWKIDY